MQALPVNQVLSLEAGIKNAVLRMAFEGIEREKHAAPGLYLANHEQFDPTSFGPTDVQLALRYCPLTHIYPHAVLSLTPTSPHCPQLPTNHSFTLPLTAPYCSQTPNRPRLERIVRASQDDCGVAHRISQVHCGGHDALGLPLCLCQGRFHVWVRE